jgi:Fic family protein
MKVADFVPRETDPFDTSRSIASIPTFSSPLVARLHALWAAHRKTVDDLFPPPPGLPKDRNAYLKAVDEIYKHDAYHSLSIEGYQVSPALIERVRGGQWGSTAKDNEQTRDALAAKGYWLAFEQVKTDVAKVLDGADPGKVGAEAHRTWFRALFQPFVAAGIIGAASLAGYRNHPVYIRNSKHVPPRWEAVSEAMAELFLLISNEPSPAVRAVLGHWLFGYIHPYPDGNGRVARFLMNLMLASGGYSWTVIPVNDRTRYMEALETASTKDQIEPFALIIKRYLTQPLTDLAD